MKYLLLFTLLFLSSITYAVDMKGKVSRIWLHKSGDLWVKMDNSAFDQHCKPGWFGFNLFVPKESDSFPYYYSLIASAQAKDQYVYIANISVFDGTSACDITKTGYGLVVLSD